MFDPGELAWEEAATPIYLGRHAEVRCLVSPEDANWVSQWRWKFVAARGCPGKLYAFRTTRWKGRHVGIYLHKEILLRHAGPPPSEDHIVGDHMDGDTLNCRWQNLRWATPSQNQENRHGFYAIQLRLALKMGQPARIPSGLHRGPRARHHH